MDINQIIDNIYSIPETARKKLKENIVKVSLPKGYLLLKAEKVETSVYFIKKGIARAYTFQDDNEITFWLGKEGDTIISMRSYVENKKGYENIELLEECDLYELKTTNLQKL